MFIVNECISYLIYIRVADTGGLDGRHLTPPPPPPPPPPFSGAKFFFLYKVGVDKKEAVDEKIDKK